MTLNNKKMLEMDYPVRNTQKRSTVLHLFPFVIVKNKFGFKIDVLTLHITLSHQNNNGNRLSRQN